jgi:hypothetical protein
VKQSRFSAMSSPSLPGPSLEPERQFAVYSLVLAGVAFALFTVAFAIVTNMPNSAPEAAIGAALWFFIVIGLLVVPLMQLAGIVLGVAALFRTGDRKLLGVMAALLNLFLLAGGVVLSVIMIAAGGGTR